MSRDVHKRYVTVDSIGRKRTWPSLAERLWRRVDKSGGPDACWPFVGARSNKGYGSLGGGGSHGGGGAHRVAYEAANGPIPDGLFVCHSCDNPPCCNPAHLWLGTTRDNMQDMAAKGRTGDTRNERSGKAKLSDAQVTDIRTRWAEGETLNALALEYRVHDSYLSRVVRGARRPAEDARPLPTRNPRISAAADALAKSRSRERRQAQIAAASAARALRQERTAAQREIREHQHAEAQRLYEDGLTLTEAGKHVGLHPSTVLRVLRDRGVEVRAPNAYLAAIDLDAVKRMHAGNIRAGEMCQVLGIGRMRLYQVFDELGLPRFGPGAPPSSVRAEAARSEGGAT